MRMTILIVALALCSTTAFAGPSRSLSLAANEPAQTTNQPASEEPKPQASAPVERPKLVPEAQANAPVDAEKPAAAKKPRKRRESTEARVIYELHRHGVYW